MPPTVAAHQSWGHLPENLSEYTVFGATAVCADMGRVFLVNYTGEWELGIVSDCSNIPSTKAWFADNRILLEVDFETAERWGVVGKGGVAVSMAYVHCEVVPGSMGVVAI